MTLGSDSTAGSRDTMIFVVCLLLSVVARADPVGVSEELASGLRRTVLAPLIHLQRQTQLIRDRRAEFDRLVVQRDSAIMRASEVPRVAAENRRLRALLQLGDRLSLPFVAAEILHQVEPGDQHTLIVTAGTRDGVRRWAPVVAPGGLIGFVSRVDRSTSIVHTWTHPDFRASAITADSSVAGIVAPRVGIGPTTLLELREVAHLSDLGPGTLVVTSGLGGVYPRGIRLGRIRRLEEERPGLSKTYLMDPAVHPASVSHVLILLPPVPADSGRA